MLAPQQRGSPVLLGGVIGALAAAILLANVSATHSAEIDALAIERARAQLSSDVRAMQARSDTEVNTQQALRAGISVLVIGGAIAAATFLVGGACVAIRHLNQRASAVYAGANGMYPLQMVRAGGRTLLVDPNRLMHPITQFGNAAGASILPKVLRGQVFELPMPQAPAPEDQLRVTTQAQAVQLATAAGNGRAATVGRDAGGDGALRRARLRRAPGNRGQGGRRTRR